MISDGVLFLQDARRTARQVGQCATRLASRRGFSLVEMMTAVAIAAIMLAIAVPNMGMFVRSSRVNASQAELVSALMLARNEAAKRGVRVGVAASAPAVGAEFSNGWTVWVDDNNDSVVDAGETVIRTYPAVAADLLVKTNGATVASFGAAGFLAPATPITFKVCSQAPPTKGIQILLQPVGLTDIQETSTCP